MKRTNFRFSFPLGKMVLLPLMLLGLFVFTASSVNAQSFKSPEAAGLAVKEALAEMMPLTSNPNTLELKQTAANARVFSMFSAVLESDVEAAYQSVEQKLDTSYGTGNAKVTTKVSKEVSSLMNNAKQALLELISN